jgi:hypothetical protein
LAWIRNRPLGLVYRDVEQSFGGYTLFCSVRGHYATLLDDEGRIVRRWRHDEGITHAKLLANGNLLVHTLPPDDAGGAEQIGGSAAALLELDPDGKIVWEYREPLLHHDYQRLPGGNTLILLWRRLPVEVSEQVGGGHHHKSDPECMYGDVVQEITPDGRVANEWRSWEHLSFEDDRICPLESHKEWTHANSLDLTPDGDWLISFRLTSTVAIVDPASGAFKWKWGSKVLSHQHAASWLDNGHVLIFDNGCHRRRHPSFSQVLEVDPANDEIVWTYRDPTILGFYSFMGSAADRLANGNTFITEGATGRLFEVTPEMETVWEYVSPFLLEGRFGPTPAIFRAHRYASDDPRLAGYTLAPEPFAELTRRISAREIAPGEE